jgi:four helix bundle protein
MERPSHPYDLESRLLDYAAAIVRLVDALPATRAGNHIAGHLLRAGTAPLPSHGEAQAAESAGDFVHKMSVGLKELREAIRWLRLLGRLPTPPPLPELGALVEETDELIRIFAASVRTARRRQCSPPVHRQ